MDSVLLFLNKSKNNSALIDMEQIPENYLLYTEAVHLNVLNITVWTFANYTILSVK